MQSSKKKKTSISNKLKEVLTDLTVDVFGYEKTVTKHINQRLQFFSEKLKKPKERLSVRLFQKDHRVKALLFYNNMPIVAIPIEELAYFFIDIGTASLPSLQNKIAFSIKRYIKDFSDAHRIFEEHLYIKIHLENTKVKVDAFYHSDLLQSIKLLTLIKYFRQ